MVAPSLFHGRPAPAGGWNTHFLEGQQEALGWGNLSLRTLLGFCVLCSRTGEQHEERAHLGPWAGAAKLGPFLNDRTAKLLSHLEHRPGATKASGKVLDNNNGNNFVPRATKGNKNERILSLLLAIKSRSTLKSIILK